MSIKRALQIGGYGRRHLGRMRQGRLQVMNHLQAPDAHPVPMPTFVQLRVTNLCNLRCKMCGQWGDTGIYRADGENLSASDGSAERQRIRELIGFKRQMGLSDYLRLLDELAPHNPIVGLFGGEPLLYPDVIPLMQAVKERGLSLTMITNAWHLEEHAEEMVRMGMDSIAVSVDGPPTIHNRTRGKSDSYERLAAGIRAVAHWRKVLKRPLPMTLAILPITELNIDHMGEAVEALRELPLDAINVGLRWFIPEDVGGEYEAVMRETFGVEATSWRGFRFTWPNDEVSRARQMQDLAKLLRGLRRRRLFDAMGGKPWISFNPAIAPQDVPRYFDDYQETFGHSLCPVAWYFAQIEPDGDVTFCGDFPDYIIGNVRQTSFEEVWRGEKAEAFRAKLQRESLPICNRCCGSFVYGRWQRPTP